MPLTDPPSEPSSFADLERATRGFRHVLDMAAALLRYLREQQGRYAKLHHTFIADVRARFEPQAARVVADPADWHFTQFAGDTRPADVLAGLKSVGPDERLVRARVFAESLDREYGGMFYDLFVADHPYDEWVPEPGDPVPRPFQQVRKEVARPNETTTGVPRDLVAPSKLPEGVDVLPRLQLVPEAGRTHGKTFVFDTRFSHQLEELVGPYRQAQFHGLKIGTALLNERIDVATGVANNLVVNPGPHGAATVYTVGPTTPAEQVRRMKAVLARAQRLGLDLLVFPELCTDKAGLDAVFAHYHASGSRCPKVFVGGSYHAGQANNATDPARNQAEAAFSGVPNGTASHRKHEPYIFTSGGVTYTENLDRENVLRVYFSRNWHLSMLICLDAITKARILDPLALVGVNLLLVPALTDDVSSFRHLLVGYVQSTAALVVVANNPVLRSRPAGTVKDIHALFVTPERAPLDTPTQFKLKKGFNSPHLCWVILDDGRGPPQWVKC